MQVHSELYRGYKIWQNTALIEKSSELSGHSWNEVKLLNSYYVSGKDARVCVNFKSINLAKEHIDFLIKVRENCL